MALPPSHADGEAAAAVGASKAPADDGGFSGLSSVRAAELALLATTCVWGAGFVITKLALERLSPLVFIAVRFFIGTVCLLPVLWRDLRREHAGGGFCVGLLLFSGFWLQTAGLNHTTPSRNAFLTALCIPLTPLIECALLWRPPKGTELASAAIATLGTFCLTREPGGDAAAAAGAPAFSTSVSVGDWLSFSCAIVFAFHVLAMNRFATRGPGAAPTVAFGQVATTGVLATLACGAFEAPAVRNVTPSLMLAMLFCGAVATAGGFLAFTRAQGRMSATRSMIICSTEPLFAALTSFLWLGESLGAVPLLGAALIVLSVVLPELRVDLPPAPAWLPPGPLTGAWGAARRALAPAGGGGAAAGPAGAAAAADGAREMDGLPAGQVAAGGGEEEGERVGLLAAEA